MPKLCYQRGSDGVPLAPLISQRIKTDLRPEHWHLIVEGYTSREMTREVDKLPALYGLASLYQQSTNDVYRAGLWQSSIIGDLLWRTQYVQYGNRVDFRRPQKYRAPSWSWASIDGNVIFWSPRNLEPRTRYIGYHYGSNMDLLSLSGPLLPGRIILDTVVFKLWQNSHIHKKQFMIRMDGKQSEAQNRSVRIDELWFLLLGSKTEGYGLILSKDILGYSFQRTGIFRVYPTDVSAKPWEDIFGGCEDSEIVLK